MRKLRKILSAILVVVLCVQIIAPGTVAIGATRLVGNNAAMSAADGVTLTSQNNDLEVAEIDAVVSADDSVQEISDSKIVTPIMGEIEELRTENTKHYRHKDGTYTAAIYPEPIHYMDSTGSWQDIDNTLTLNSKKKSTSGKATYTPAASSLDIRIPQDFSSNQMLTIGKNGYTIGMRIKSSNDLSITTMSNTSVAKNISSVKAVIDNNFGDKDFSEVSILTNIDNSGDTAIRIENEEKMKIENKISAVNYNDIFNGADLQYVITPSKVKENIIVNQKQDSYTYQFELNLDGLIPVLQDNGSIKIYENADNSEALFVIEAPYMYDANEETSFDVTMVLNNNILTVIADSEWINNEERVFPIIIDPTISITPPRFYDATANKNTPIMNFQNYKYLYAGNGLLNFRRTYFKFLLPQLPEGGVVTNAELTLYQNDVDLGDEESKLVALDLTGPYAWSDDSLTWDNQPVSKEKNGPHSYLKKIDYDTFKVENDKGKYYVFNLTKAVKNWYERYSNNGILITSSDETKNSQTTLYSSDHSDSSLKPYVKIEYINNIGLEDYWTYETIDLGRSGNVYANPYNGTLTYVHNDLSMTGNLLPINISHIYNGNTSDVYSTKYSGMSVGDKFHLNIQEILIKKSTDSDESYEYKHYDSDGTLHYYIERDNKITHEYDPTKTISIDGTDYVLSDCYGNKKVFNSSGQLYKIIDNNSNEITITIKENKITQVTDTVGRIVKFEYDDQNQLIMITEPSNRVIAFTYSGTGKLFKIIYPDGNETFFNYNSEHISKIGVYDNSYIFFTYRYDYYSGYRLETIREHDKTEEAKIINTTTFRFSEKNDSGISTGNVVVSDSFGHTNKYLFDSFGRVSSVTNENGQTLYSVYGNESDKATFNKIIDSSEFQTITTNLLKNHGFEKTNDCWNVLQTTSQGSYDILENKEKSSLGNYYLQLELTTNSDAIEIAQDFLAEGGQTYTVSTDINIPEPLLLNGNSGALFGVVYCIDGIWKNESSRWIGSTNGWERFSHTFTLPSGNVENCHVFVELANSKGYAYFDNVQVEKSGGAHPYNLIENSNFSIVLDNTTTPSASLPYAWEGNNTESTDGVYYRDWGKRNFYEMSGSYDLQKSIGQCVPVNAKPGDTLIVGGQAAAYSSSNKNDERFFDIYIELYDENGEIINNKTTSVDFDKLISQDHQVNATFITLDVSCAYLWFYFRYYNQVNGVSFDDAFVYVTSYGEHYDYNDNGQIAKVDNDEGKTTQYHYPTTDDDITNDNEVERITEVVSGVEQTVAEYSYDDNHNVTTAKNNLGTRIEYVYNDNGQVITQTTITTDENEEITTMTESFNYYQNGNYIRSYINEADEGVAYVYDNDAEGNNITKGLVTSVTDPNGNITTYTYDPYTDELLSTSGEAEYSVPITTSFTYENYSPKTITRNGTTYSYDYDSQNRITASKVGTQTLATNSYDSRQRLSQVTYANNAVYTPAYDSRDRLAGDSWNGTQISEYYYNDNDRLSKLVDNVTDVSYQYDYAFYGLPFRVTGSDGTQTTYDYDRSGNLARLTFGDDNDIIYSGKYYTNEKGAPEDVVIDTLDNTLMHYNYDDFGRVESYSYGPVIRTINYTEGSVGYVPITNNRIAEITDENKNGDTLQNYYLEYNVDGSLHFSIENKDQEYYDYFYDGLGRVIENYANGDVYGYLYDDGGNLTAVTRNVETLHTYTYGNANWKDQLTAFDGKAITYDANGNPISYDGYTYTWQRGTQLANITGNGKNIGYVYDSQGYRVQKTVNGVTTNYIYSGDLLMRQTDGTNTLDFQYDASGNMVGFKYNGTPYYYLRNLLNDISGIVDSDGNIVAKYRYDAYGNTILATGTMAAINPIRYRGYYFDAETNWYYLNSRYYNPEWCRFISADCLFIAGDTITGSNMYAYCNDNPVMYVDSAGAIPELNNIDYTKVAEGIRIISGTMSKLLTPFAEELFSGITDELLFGLKGFFGPNFATSSFMIFVGTPLLCLGSITLLPLLDVMIEPEQKFPESPEFIFPTGIRHTTPWSMEFLTGYAEYFLGFESDGNGNYVTNPSKFMWQSMVGYNWFYDFFFSLGGPIKKVVFPFEASMTGLLPNASYAVWCWKADYWNLGAGAEIGIYWQPIKSLAERGFYRIDQWNLLVDVNMQVTYDHSKDELSPRNDVEVLTGAGEPDSSLKQTSWWITTFSPRIQFVDLEALNVCQAVNFAESGIHNNLYESFLNTYSGDNKPVELFWSVSGSQWEYLNSDSDYPYEFYIQY